MEYLNLRNCRKDEKDIISRNSLSVNHEGIIVCLYTGIIVIHSHAGVISSCTLATVPYRIICWGVETIVTCKSDDIQSMSVPGGSGGMTPQENICCPKMIESGGFWQLPNKLRHSFPHIGKASSGRLLPKSAGVLHALEACVH